MSWKDAIRKNDNERYYDFGDRSGKGRVDIDEIEHYFNPRGFQKFLEWRLKRATKSLEWYENEEYKDEGEIIPEYQSKVFEEYINMLKREIKHLKDFIPRYMKIANEIEDWNEYYEDLNEFLQKHISLIGG